MKLFGRRFIKELKKRGIEVERGFTINLEVHYTVWNRNQRRQFREALGLYEYPYEGYFVDEGKLPEGHPAREKRYSSRDITLAACDLINRFDHESRKANLMVRGERYEFA